MNFSSYLLPQSKNNSCGLAALQTLISYVQKDKNYLMAPIAKSASNFLRMEQIALKHGITLEARKVTAIKKLRHEKGPLILQLKINNLLHFVTVKRKFGFYILNDPNGKSYVVSEKTLAEYFTLHYISVTAVNKIKRQEKFKIKTRIGLLYFLNTLFVAAIFSAFYFLGSLDFIIFAYLFFALSFFLFLFERITRILLFKRFDEEVIAKILRQESSFDLGGFKKLSAVKATLFSYKYEKYSLLLNLLFVAGLFVINGPVFIIVILLLFLFALFTHFIEKLQSDKVYLLTQQEKVFFSGPIRATKKLYLAILKESVTLVSWYEFTKIIFYFLIFTVTFLLMNLALNFHLNFFLFYFFAFIYLYEETRKFLKLREKRGDYYLANFLVNELK